MIKKSSIYQKNWRNKKKKNGFVSLNLFVPAVLKQPIIAHISNLERNILNQYSDFSSNNDCSTF
jgi:hypothetical protein